MKITFKKSCVTLLLCAARASFLTSNVSAEDLTAESRQALHQVAANHPAAARLNKKAVAVLVFPRVVKAGFIVGAQTGEGTLFVHGQPAGRYRTVAGSYGLQA